MKKTFLFSLLFITVIFLNACEQHFDEDKNNSKSPGHAAAPDEPSYGDMIIEGSIGDASNLILMLASDSSSHDIAGLCYNGLVKYDKDLKLTGDLAESWDVSDDQLTITFHLRKGVRWQDGVELTAEDVMFGYRTIIDPATPTAYAGDFMEVDKAEVVDPYTFRVTYKEPFAPGLGSWSSLVVLPKHLLEGQDITKSALTRNPMGTGAVQT